ncbi:MAG: EAL domain-containing protein [Lachnospiraceae bacterium]|nr:EAL domain-containing protein [Lachnospiraceae bacterium]
MFYFYQFDIAGLLILLLTTSTLWMRQRSVFRHGYYALLSIITASIYIVCDGLSTHLVTLGDSTLYGLTYAVFVLYYASLIFFPYFALQFIAGECGEYGRSGYSLLFPLFSTMLLVFCNYSTGVFFRLNRYPFGYAKGKLIWLIPALYAFFMCAAAIVVREHFRMLGRERHRILRLVGLIAVFSYVFNLYLPNYCITGFAIAICVCLTVVGFYLADSVMDPLTGIFNKRGFTRACNEAIYKNKSNDLILAKVKVHNMQEINERFGTHVGDLVLIRMAESLIQGHKQHPMVFGRIGGDTFAVLVNRSVFTNRMFHANLGQFVGELLSDRDYEVTFYCGIYELHAEDCDVDGILDRATFALNHVRGSFKDYVQYFDEALEEEYDQRSRIEQMARSALKHDALRVYLQPIYDTMTRRLVSAEALVRWMDNDGSLIAPDEFIPIFERNGFITQVDLFVLEEICKNIRAWINRGIEPVPVSVNVSRVDITSPHFADEVTELVDRYEIDHSLIKIELTESAFNSQISTIDNCMNRLRQQGFKILMDDFGSGYSNLNMFQDIFVDIVKIDMKFLRNIEQNSRGRVILNSVVDMSKHLGLEIVVEGVETEEQFRIVREMSCEMTQGYYFSRPMPLRMFDDLLIYEYDKHSGRELA